MILKNEILYSSADEIIYKTINLDANLYGMFSTKYANIVEPSFLHIFKFDDDKTVIIDQNELYWEIDLSGTIYELDAEREEEYRGYIIKNSNCNCMNYLDSGSLCQICNGNQQIENSYVAKSFNKFFDLD